MLPLLPLNRLDSTVVACNPPNRARQTIIALASPYSSSPTCPHAGNPSSSAPRQAQCARASQLASPYPCSPAPRRTYIRAYADPPARPSSAYAEMHDLMQDARARVPSTPAYAHRIHSHRHVCAPTASKAEAFLGLSTLLLNTSGMPSVEAAWADKPNLDLGGYYLEMKGLEGLFLKYNLCLCFVRIMPFAPPLHHQPPPPFHFVNDDKKQMMWASKVGRPALQCENGGTGASVAKWSKGGANGMMRTKHKQRLYF
ncbi:hypothetical protein FIBSPDRAFT_885647 [Athelia psychrophila]|uniref:Uncharacterized protein n=1 Tax=Athelia psychrophila TaxID=1759441 RepID=A0A166RL60_9AGAM|nr:hypothetical protein FIBSPDRAFT_885647 [Fibularhizoctonia sp. CBS 109695]